MRPLTGVGARRWSPGARSPLGGDFRLLWWAYAVSRFGTAFSSGAVVVVAVDRLGVGVSGLTLMLGLSRLVGALASVPVGLLIERHRKRPALVLTDVSRCLVTLSVPLLLWGGRLTPPLLGVAMAADTLATIAARSASGAHLKDLVPGRHRGRAYARLETTDWTFTALFTPLGGIVVTVLGPEATLAVDALTYLVSAVVLRRITRAEAPPGPIEVGGVRGVLAQSVGGWRHIWSSRQLRALFGNAMLFGGSLVPVSPLLAVLALGELGLAAWQYTVILGLPALGGVVGSALAPRVAGRISTRRTLLLAGAGRTVWTVWIALSPPGTSGFVVILAAESALMLFAGVFNPVFAAYQISITADDHLARTSAAWGATAMTVQPLFVLAGGALTGLLGLRGTIATAGALLAASSLLLPWRSLGGHDPSPVVRGDPE